MPQNVQKQLETLTLKVNTKRANLKVVCICNIVIHCCFLEQETLPLLLSTGWFQERIRA